MSDKRIMVVPSGIFERYNVTRTNQLITGLAGVELLQQIISQAFYMPRSSAEVDVRFRQPIPYCLVQNRATHDFCVMRRQPKQQEGRLHGKVYLGVGGHVDDGEALWDAVSRELTEEFFGDGPIANAHIIFSGIILTYGDVTSTGVSVDDVHVGIFHHVVTDQKAFTQELDMHEPQWMSAGRLRGLFPNMELWSQVVLNQYILR